MDLACAYRAGGFELPSMKRMEGVIGEAAADYYKGFRKNVDDRLQEMDPLVRHFHGIII